MKTAEQKALDAAINLFFNSKKDMISQGNKYESKTALARFKNEIREKNIPIRLATDEQCNDLGLSKGTMGQFRVLPTGDKEIILRKNAVFRNGKITNEGFNVFVHELNHAYREDNPLIKRTLYRMEKGEVGPKEVLNVSSGGTERVKASTFFEESANALDTKWTMINASRLQKIDERFQEHIEELSPSFARRFDKMLRFPGQNIEKFYKKKEEGYLPDLNKNVINNFRDVIEIQPIAQKIKLKDLEDTVRINEFVPEIKKAFKKETGKKLEKEFENIRFVPKKEHYGKILVTMKHLLEGNKIALEMHKNPRIKLKLVEKEREKNALKKLGENLWKERYKEGFKPLSEVVRKNNLKPKSIKENVFGKKKKEFVMKDVGLGAKNKEGIGGKLPKRTKKELRERYREM